MSLATWRNILIIVAIAAVVAIVPGGGAGASVVIQVISLAFLVSLAWIASIMYRQHRMALYALGDGRRAILYGSVVVATLTLTATPRLWSTSGGSVAWFVLVCACAYAFFTVLWSARRY